MIDLRVCLKYTNNLDFNYSFTMLCYYAQKRYCYYYSDLNCF